MRIGQHAIEVRTPARLALVLCLWGSLVGSPSRAEGIHPELGLAFSGLLPVGDLAKLSGFGLGGDGALHVVQIYRGFGIRGALGYERLDGHEIPTGEDIFNGTGTQEGKFRATQNYLWTAIGPEWRAPVGASHVDLYLMFGRADVKADYSQAWLDTQGDAPGSTRISLHVVGATWIAAGTPVELGMEFVSGGSAALWADPPVVVNGAGQHILQSTTASITGFAFRVGYRFWHQQKGA